MEQQILQYSPLLLIAYILVKDILPKLVPSLDKVLNRHLTREDRLFKIIEESNEVHKNNALVLFKIDQHLTMLTEAVHNIDGRLETVEGHIRTSEVIKVFKSGNSNT